MPTGVSRWFRQDWNRLKVFTTPPILRGATITIVLMPLFLNVSELFPSIPTFDRWLLWGASISYGFAYLIFLVRCPALIKDYPDYSFYLARGNSHRWIIWEYWLHLPILRKDEQKRLLEETLFKKVALSVNDAVLLKLFPQSVQVQLNNDDLYGDLIPFDRDIALPFQLENTTYVLPANESETVREEKQKELYWMLYTEVTKSRTPARYFGWFFLAIAGILVGVWVLKSVAVVVGFDVWVWATMQEISQELSFYRYHD